MEEIIQNANLLIRLYVMIHLDCIRSRHIEICDIKDKNVKWSRYSPGVAQRVGRGIALLFHDRGTRRGWVVSSTLRPHFTPGKDPVPILQEPGWAPGPIWTGWNSRPHRDSISDRPARSRSLFRLSYSAHNKSLLYKDKIYNILCQITHR